MNSSIPNCENRELGLAPRVEASRPCRSCLSVFPPLLPPGLQALFLGQLEHELFLLLYRHLVHKGQKSALWQRILWPSFTFNRRTQEPDAAYSSHRLQGPHLTSVFNVYSSPKSSMSLLSQWSRDSGTRRDQCDKGAPVIHSIQTMFWKTLVKGTSSTMAWGGQEFYMTDL